MCRNFSSALAKMSDDSSAPDSVKKLFPELEMNDKLLNLLQLKGIVIETAIRKGSFGHVYRGWHQKLEKPIALKVLFLEAMNPQLKEKLLPREIETMRQLSQKGHPHLVAILDVMHASRKLFILMELANSDMAHILAKTGPITEPITAHLMGQVASGLRFLHIDHRLTHRDLKLENVLFFGEMTVKLADFGFSRQSWDWTNNRPILCESFCGKCSTLVTACLFDNLFSRHRALPFTAITPSSAVQPIRNRLLRFWNPPFLFTQQCIPFSLSVTHVASSRTTQSQLSR